MVAIVGVVVHENNDLRAQVQGLELKRSDLDALVNENPAIQTAKNAFAPKQKSKHAMKPPRPPIQSPTSVHSYEGF